MRKLLLGTVLAGLLACDGGPAGLDPDSFVGRWVIHNEANASCAGAAGAGDRIFVADDGPLASGVVNVVSEWDFVEPDRYNWLVTGNFNIPNRTVELNFWHTPLEVGAMFTGTIKPDGTIEGVILDPKPGYDPHTVIGSCTFTATGSRTP